jgi:hypothetical protein
VQSISRFLLFVNAAHGILAEPHSPVTNPHVRIGQIIHALSPRLGEGFAGIHLDEKCTTHGCAAVEPKGQLPLMAKTGG